MPPIGSRKNAAGPKRSSTKKTTSKKSPSKKSIAKAKAAASVKVSKNLVLPSKLDPQAQARSKAVTLSVATTYSKVHLKNNYRSWCKHAFGKEPIQNTKDFIAQYYPRQKVPVRLMNEHTSAPMLLEDTTSPLPRAAPVVVNQDWSPGILDALDELDHSPEPMIDDVELVNLSATEAAASPHLPAHKRPLLHPQTASSNTDNQRENSLSDSVVRTLSVSLEPDLGTNTVSDVVSSASKALEQISEQTRQPSKCLGPEKWFSNSFPWNADIEHTNRDIFHNDSFRVPQKAAINSIMAGCDTLVLLPTGGGKSLIYQIPAVARDGFAIVVMPLISLMIDQCTSLKSKGIRAEVLTGACSVAQSREIYELMRSNSVDVLFITPEKFGASGAFKNLLTEVQDNITLFVIDEAHCISQWGSDFRPDYRKLSILRNAYSQIPILALTASATSKSIADICNQLHMREPQIFRKSFDRTNIKYIVKQRETGTNSSPLATMIKKLRQNQTGIIYCLTRNECTVLADKLRSMGIKCGCYHAGLTPAEREKAQTEWMQDVFCIMIATIAFGLGIDKPDVRFIIHLTLPKSIENFFQESGRAGRDGLPSESYLFWDYSDKARLQRLQNGNTNCTKAINFMLDYCSNTSVCRRTQLLDYFGEQFDPENCVLQCDNCERNSGANQIRTLDASREARLILDFVTSINVRDKSKWSPGLTLADLRNLLLGKKIKKQEYFEQALRATKLFGALKTSWTPDRTQLLLQKLLASKILSEKTIKLPHRGVTTYLYPGMKSRDVDSFTMEAKVSGTMVAPSEDPCIDSRENIMPNVNDADLDQLFVQSYNNGTTNSVDSAGTLIQRDEPQVTDRRNSISAQSDNPVEFYERPRASITTQVGTLSDGSANPYRFSSLSENDTAAFAEEFSPIRRTLTGAQQEDLITELIIERKRLKQEHSIHDSRDILSISDIQFIAKNCPDNIFQLSALEILSDEQIAKFGCAISNTVKRYLVSI